MKRTIIAVSLLIVVGLSTGCNRAKDMREAEQEIDRQTDRAKESDRLNGYNSGYAYERGGKVYTANVMEVQGSSLVYSYLLHKPSPEQLQAIKDTLSCSLIQVEFKEYLFTDIRLVTEDHEYVDSIKTPLICKDSPEVPKANTNTEPHVTLFRHGEGWLALEKMRSMDDEPGLREFSPEWNRIQAEIDKEVASINDPSLRASERKRVSERLLPQDKLDQLLRQVSDLSFQKRKDYISAHKDEYWMISNFSTEDHNYYPRNVMCIEVQPDVERDGILFYKGKQEKSDSVSHFLRLTVREMDTALTKFHVLNEQQISQYAARGIPSRTHEQAELAVWDSAIHLVAQADVDGWEGGEPHLVLRKDSPIYLVDIATGTIPIEVPRAAFCFEKDKSWDERDRRCENPREPRSVNVRVLVATHRNLEQRVRDGLFREDLYYRLAVVPIHIPPLRARREDIALLAELFARQIATELNLPARRLSPQAVQSLTLYDFPGNIRELKNLIERAYVLSVREELGPESFPMPRPPEALVSSVPGNGQPPEAQRSAAQFPEEPFDLTGFLEKTEKELILRTLGSTNGAQAEAARRMGLSRSALAYKLNKYGIRATAD